MNRIVLFMVFIVGITFSATAQFGYDQYSQTNGLKISTKWGKAKTETGEKKTALLIGIENLNEYPVEFSFDINLYYEGINRENGRIENQCLLGRTSMIGKLNGIYFIPENFTEEQLKNSSFNFEIEDIEVTKTDGCEE